MHDTHRQFRTATVVFAVALAVHAADHIRRGFDVLTVHVNVIGNTQTVLAVATIVLVFANHAWARPLAITLGFASAIGFVGAHMLPHWSAFSDSFTGAHHAPGVTAFSWFAAIFEIVADIALGVTAVRARPWPVPVAATARSAA